MTTTLILLMRKNLILRKSVAVNRALLLRLI